MTAPELDGFLRGALAELDATQPGAARPEYLRGRHEAARAAFTAAVADETGLPEVFVRELLGRREQLRAAAQHSFEAWRLAADTGFVTAVMAAGAWSRAADGKAAAKRRQVS